MKRCSSFLFMVGVVGVWRTDVTSFNLNLRLNLPPLILPRRAITTSSSVETNTPTLLDLTNDKILVPSQQQSSALSTSSGTNDMMNVADFKLRREFQLLLDRFDKLERTIALSQVSAGKSKVELLSVTGVMEALNPSSLEFNAKNVELTALVTFFTIGAIVGASMLRNLWLLGGLYLGWWASGAVHRDTRGGSLVRKVAVQVLQFMREVNEKYVQATIFYKTGQLAYMSSKVWDRYDKEWSITKRLDELKKQAMARAADFNTYLEDRSVYQQLGDVWGVLLAVPTEAKKIDDQYGISSGVWKIGAGLWASTSDFVAGGWSDRTGDSSSGNSNINYSRVTSRGISAGRSNSFLSAPRKRSYTPWANNNKKDNRRQHRHDGRSTEEVSPLGAILSVFDGARGRRRNFDNYRGRVINPWIGPWSSLPFFKSKKT